jgi:SNF2 family DNA or RNA helicase
MSPTGDALVLNPQWNEVELLKLMPGARYRSRTKSWEMTPGYASLVALRGLFGPGLTYDDNVTALVWAERAQRVDPALELRLLTELNYDHDDVTARLYPFQRAGVRFMQVAESGLLGDELGVGKTVQALVYMHLLRLFPVFIVCPNSVKHHWAIRVNAWVPGATPYVVEGGTVKGRKVLAAAAEDSQAVIIINYESVRSFSRLAAYGSIKLKRCRVCDPRFGDENLKSSQCHVHPKELNAMPFQMAFIDEAHHVGDPKSQQTRAVWSITHAPTIKHAWALTGTPDNLERLWAIMHTVQPAEYPTRSLWLDRYAMRSWNAYGGLDIVGIRPDTRDELMRILDPRFRRMLLDVVMPQMPPVVREVRQSQLTSNMRKQYNDLEERLFTKLDDGQLFLTANKMVARARQLQFAAGTVLVEKPDEDDVSSWHVKITEPSPKLDTMEEILDELGTQTAFVVACLHRDVVDMAAERLARRNIRHQIIYAGVHPQVRAQACEDLKTGALQAIVFTIDSGGEGLDMSGAGVMIRLQRSWSFINSQQSEGRTRRIGSERHEVIRIIDVVTEDTREEYQIEKLLEKFEQFEQIARDREQVRQQLVTTPATDPWFYELVSRLDYLNRQQTELLTSDDLEIEPIQLEESA